MVTVHPASAHVGAGDPGSGSGDLTAEVAVLQQFDVAALRRRWRDLVGGAMPADLGRPLLLRMLAYRLQAQRLGDLDRASLRALAGLATPTSTAGPGSEGSPEYDDHGGASRDAVVSSAATGDGPDAAPATQRSCSAPTAPAAPARIARIARPGTVLLREHGGVAHRVTVLADGFSWNGRSYTSLSQVAFAITGTRWNGPRFFGLRDRPAAEQPSAPPSRSKAQADAGAAAVAARRTARVTRTAPLSARSAAS